MLLFIDVDGGWGEWGSWSSCSVTCGSGTETRTKECDNPAPKGTGADCTGDSSESQQCDAGVCPGMLVVVVVVVVVVVAVVVVCLFVCCVVLLLLLLFTPVDGGWGEWSGFGECTVSCGGGIRTRTRNCDDPPNSNGGLECVGDKINFENCNQHSCGEHNKVNNNKTVAL